MSKQSILYVVAAPSGGGKTSLVNALVQSEKDIRISVSYTTRPPRPGEKEGLDYHFIDEPTFRRMIEDGVFLEYAEVFGYLYGTSKQWIVEQLTQGIDVVLEIDWQGARQIARLFHHLKLIFILPPSLDVLRKRLETRKQDSPEVIQQRMQQAITEMSHYREFGYLIVNDDFDVALANLRAILHAERLKRSYQEEKLSELLADLLEKR